MATDVEVPLLENQFDRLSIASEESVTRSIVEGEVNRENEESCEKWGFQLKDLYRLALRFYKEKEGKAIHLSYQNKLILVAYKCQVSHGSFSKKQESLSPLGVLDVIGRDRRLTWQSLGDLSKEDAMMEFVELLDNACPLFRPYIEANKRDIAERDRKHKVEEKRKKKEEEKIRIEEEKQKKEEEDQAKQEAQRRQIQEALNQQTYTQFMSYAEQQFPGNPEQQAVLIRQLQEHHYHQYMQQLCQTQTPPVVEETGALLTNGGPGSGSEESDEEASQASMWTRKDIKEFKDAIRKEGGDAIIKVGHGETVTVRVPTHEDGTCLFWEFATDSYDIGFGVYFEWSKPESSQVSVHISESEEDDDEEEEEEEEEDRELTSGDIERGSHNPASPKSIDLSHRPPTSIVVPVYRRDCQEEVYAGSHVYPGQGVYLLKFDNSYSLWRSKTLYYRVYYTR